MDGRDFEVVPRIKKLAQTSPIVGEIYAGHFTPTNIASLSDYVDINEAHLITLQVGVACSAWLFMSLDVCHYIDVTGTPMMAFSPRIREHMADVYSGDSVSNCNRVPLPVQAHYTPFAAPITIYITERLYGKRPPVLTQSFVESIGLKHNESNYAHNIDAVPSRLRADRQ